MSKWRTVRRSIVLTLAEGLRGLSLDARERLGSIGQRRPGPRWHSFDRTPWTHPWLTSPNLRAMRDFSVELRAEAQRAAGDSTERFRYGFVGNIANNLYMRAVPLRKAGMTVDVVGAPGDHYLMSKPGWEEFDGVVEEGADSAPDGVRLPAVAGTYEFGGSGEWATARLRDLPDFVRLGDFLRSSDYLSHLPTLVALQQYDALLACQVPYLAYLSGRPYLATQSGGDVWYECSRDDVLGRLQRRGFRHAAAFLVSNPWSFAHARRLGLRNLVYLPFIIDEAAYSPGEGPFREEWRQRIGGSFFVLSTARLDESFKGSMVGVSGFAEFSKRAPGARLVQIGWGADRDRLIGQLKDLGLADRALILPISGKRRLVGYLRSGDCLLDQFVIGYFGATALEGMACGLPVVMRINRAQYAALCETGAPPVLEASSAGEVCEQLWRLCSDREGRRELGGAHRAWFLANHASARWVDAYRSMLAATARGHRFRFERSRLAAPLTEAEAAYHAAELEAAPSFPNYVEPAGATGK